MKKPCKETKHKYRGFTILKKSREQTYNGRCTSFPFYSIIASERNEAISIPGEYTLKEIKENIDNFLSDLKE